MTETTRNPRLSTVRFTDAGTDTYPIRRVPGKRTDGGYRRDWLSHSLQG